MLRKILIGLLIAAAVVVGLLAAAAFVLLRTPLGQDFVLSLALPRLSKEAGIGIEITSARGAWPAQMDLRGVRLSDRQGLWFEAERITLLWRPELALSNRYVFDAVAIQGGHLLREPETGASGPRKPRSGSRRYPFLKIGAITAKGLRVGEPLIGQALTIDLDGAMELATGGAVDAPLDIGVSASELLSKGTARLLGERIRLAARIRGEAGRSYTFEALRAESERAHLAGTLTYDVATRDIIEACGREIDAAFAAKIDPAPAQGRPPLPSQRRVHGKILRST
ncbi:MAG: hypothetical protein U1E87_08675 [Alphaproteobacteria bacterium]